MTPTGPDDVRSRQFLRAAFALVSGAVIGFVQYRIVLAGMHAAAKAAGLSGIGVGAEYAVAVGVVTVVLQVVGFARPYPPPSILEHWPASRIGAC
jgi:hypothetical protein